MSCKKPKPTHKVFNSGTGAKAWCAGCHRWITATQVPMGQERRNSAGKITASYAPISHDS